MKRTRAIYLIALFTLISMVARSQADYGKVMISGQISLKSITVTTPDIPGGYHDNAKTASIAPVAGYLIFQNFAAGLELLYNYKKSLNTNGVTTNTLQSLSFVPFLRYYFINGKIRPYFQAGAGRGFGKSSNKNGTFPETIQKSSIMIYEIKGGIELLINKHVGFDADYGYNSTTYFYKEGTEWKNTNKGSTGSLALIIYI
jgi:hypothetical protein